MTTFLGQGWSISCNFSQLRMTLALRPWTFPFWSSTGFHVNTHLDLKIWSGFKDFLKTGFKALVCNQQLSSASFARSNSRRSSEESSFIWTSARALLLALATHASSWGRGSVDHFIRSCFDMGTSSMKHWSSKCSKGWSKIGISSSARQTSGVSVPGW